MKDLSASMITHIGQATTTMASGWRVVRTDNQTFGWTDADKDVTIASVLYRASEGLRVTATKTVEGFAVDTLDVSAFLDTSDEADIHAGLWDYAEVTHFEYNWDSPPASFDNNLLILRKGNLGEVRRQDNLFVAEIRGLAQRLTTRTGRLYTPTCPWRHAVWNGSTYAASAECGASLTGKIKTGSITSVGSNAKLDFSDSAQSEADGFFDEGIITFTSGPNNGLSMDVRRWQGKQFSLYRPLPYNVAVGNTYSAVRGDDKRAATCKDVYSNLVNFGGFPHIPGPEGVHYSPVHDSV